MIELAGHSGLVLGLAYSPDGRTLASASADGSARLWDVATGKHVATLQSPAARAHCVAFAPDGKSLAVGYGSDRGLVEVWDLAPPRQRERRRANRSTTRGIAFNAAGNLLATAGDNLGVGVWFTDKLRLTLDGPPSSAVAFSPDDRFVAAVATRPATVRLWQISTGQHHRSLREISDWGYAIAFHPAGDRLAVGLERTVAVWDPADYRPPTIWPAHGGAVLGVAFTPDGGTLLTGGADGLVKLWDPAGETKTRSLHPPELPVQLLPAEQQRRRPPVRAMVRVLG
jgi:WD40 repeat protein